MCICSPSFATTGGPGGWLEHCGFTKLLKQNKDSLVEIDLDLKKANFVVIITKV